MTNMLVSILSGLVFCLTLVGTDYPAAVYQTTMSLTVANLVPNNPFNMIRGPDKDPQPSLL